MTGTPSILPLFNNQPIYDYFGFGPERTLERKAIAFLRRAYREGVPTDHLPPQDRNRKICNETIQKIEFRLGLDRRFRGSFFSTPPKNNDTLTLAIICDEYVNHINEQVQNTSGKIIDRLDDGFPDALVTRAQTLWEEALAIESSGQVGIAENFPEEALFLSHINALQNLRDYEASLNDYDAAQLPDIITQNFTPARKFCAANTEIGQELLAFIDALQSRLEEKIVHAELVAQRRASMRIIHSAPTGP